MENQPVTMVEKTVAPLWLRIVSLFIIVLGIIGTVVYLLLTSMTMFFTLGGPSDWRLPIIGIQLLNMVPVILYTIAGFGLYNLKKWSKKVLIIALIVLLIRIALRLMSMSLVPTNFIEPVIVLILIAIYQSNKRLFQ